MYKEKILMTIDLGFIFCLIWTSFQLFSKATYRFLELIVPKTQIILWSCQLTSSQIQSRSCHPMDHAPMKVNWPCCHITSEVIFCIRAKDINIYSFFLHLFSTEEWNISFSCPEYICWVLSILKISWGLQMQKQTKYSVL